MYLFYITNHLWLYGICCVGIWLFAAYEVQEVILWKYALNWLFVLEKIETPHK